MAIVRAQEEVADGPATPEGPPALGAVVGAVMQEVAALAQRPEVPEAVVGRVMVEVGRGEDRARRADEDGLHEVRPAGRAVPRVPPGAGSWVVPPPVGKAAQHMLMGPAAALAAAASPAEPHLGAQLAPVRWIEGAELRADRHAGILAETGGSVNRLNARSLAS